jgi:hypothetical protein
MIKKIYLLFFMALTLAGPGWAGSWGQGLGRGSGYGLGPCADTELNLSPEQASRLKAVQSEYLKAIRLLQVEITDRKNELRLCEPGRGKETVRTSQLRQLVRERQGQIREIWVRYKMECQSILTPEQLEQIHSIEGSRGPRPGLGRLGWGER